MISPTGFFCSVHLHLVLFCTLMIATCTNPVLAPFIMPYNIIEPVQEYKLQKSLNEVSGLNVVGRDEVALVDDEKGTIFYYNLNSSEISDEVQFAKGGDWEDLLIKGDTSYVLKSNGTLVEISQHPTHQVKSVKTYDTPLSIDNDTEGLCYDPVKKVLLIACKGQPWIEGSSEKFKGRKAIYSFNPATKKLSTTPAFLIDLNKVESMLLGLHKNAIKRVMELYNINTKVAFQPSGIAIHPLTGDLYIVSAVGNVLLVMNQEGRIRYAVKLPKKLFKQPEGITFDPSGNMYISNEGKSGKGNILKYTYQETKTL